MRALPRPIARAVALIRFNNGWLPETGDPSNLFNDLSEALGTYYIDMYGKQHQANTVLMPTVGEPLHVHTSDYIEGNHETTLRWDRQVQWAARTHERSIQGELILADDLIESQTILSVHSELWKTFEQLKPDYIKSGLPFPQNPLENNATPLSSATPRP
ncbi:hypothetical protein HY947_04660 [Candidatus Gottesmanbacteria bacterium]|nr:hypothetical protein [Candidatus Gottesmanbacteria bacterium]